VNGDNKVHIQPVQVGPQIGADWIITTGIKPGEQVVIEGNGKLIDGIPVHPHPAAPEQANADAGAGQTSAGQHGSDKDNNAKPSASSEGK
jgi:membrane fusion protein, multidrug efflux system